MVYKSYKIITSNPQLNLRQISFILQQQKMRLVKCVLDSIDDPVLCDFGADMGAIINLDEDERYDVCKTLNDNIFNLINN